MILGVGHITNVVAIDGIVNFFAKLSGIINVNHIMIVTNIFNLSVHVKITSGSCFHGSIDRNVRRRVNRFLFGLIWFFRRFVLDFEPFVLLLVTLASLGLDGSIYPRPTGLDVAKMFCSGM